MSAELLPEDIGRPAMVEKVAEGVKAAMRDAGIDDPADVHYVQTKTPLLTIDSVRDAPCARQGRSPARCTIPWACRTAPPGSASPSRSARSSMPKAEEICRNLDLYSVGRLVLVGRRADAGADRAARQQARRRRPLSHRPFGDEGRARYRRHLRVDPQCRPRSAGTAARRGPRWPRRQLLHEMRGRPHAASCAAGARS